MDNQVTKKRINDHFEYDWYKYLIILLAGIFVFYFAFSQINRTRDYEDVTVFLSRYDERTGNITENFPTRVLGEMETDSYKNVLSQVYGDAVLREVTVNAQDPLGSNEYGMLLQTQGMISSDLLIVGESWLKDGYTGFVPLTDELLEKYLLPQDMPKGTFADDAERTVMAINDLQYFYDNEEDVENRVRYGINVNAFEKFNTPYEVLITDWRLVEEYNNLYKDKPEEEQPDDTFYLVINPSSVSIGKFGKGKSKAKDTQALFVANRFIKYYSYGIL